MAFQIALSAHRDLCRCNLDTCTLDCSEVVREILTNRCVPVANRDALAGRRDRGTPVVSHKAKQEAKREQAEQREREYEQ